MDQTRPPLSAITLTACVELLAARQRQVCDELGSYARPVAACDVDFAALLVERSAIAAALAHLQPVVRGEVPCGHPRGDH